MGPTSAAYACLLHSPLPGRHPAHRLARAASARAPEPPACRSAAGLRGVGSTSGETPAGGGARGAAPSKEKLARARASSRSLQESTGQADRQAERGYVGAWVGQSA